ncbi:MAG: DegT/DnrJ/EryC1/StrS family aminotransferase, partial [Acidimicrobiales bacterium]
LLAGVGSGDEVLVPTFTFAASANAALYLGARPVFVDSDPSTWQIDPTLVEQELESRSATQTLPAAVMSVDLYGQTADYAKLESLCARYGVPLVEDAAEALGATYGDRSAGSFGTAAVFSFNGNKIVTTSGGGMLVTSSEELAGRARKLATQAREPFVHYEHAELGYNYRLSNLLAALGRAQLRGLDERIERRTRINGRYRADLSALDGITFMPVATYGRSNHWLTCMIVDPEVFGADRDQIMSALEAQDIEARPTWKPLHLQPLFQGARVLNGDVSAGIFERGLCLPSGSNLSDSDLDRVVDAILDVSRVHR